MKIASRSGPAARWPRDIRLVRTILRIRWDLQGAAGTEALFRRPLSACKPLIAGATMTFNSVFVVNNGLCLRRSCSLMTRSPTTG